MWDQNWKECRLFVLSCGGGLLLVFFHTFLSTFCFPHYRTENESLHKQIKSLRADQEERRDKQELASRLHYIELRSVQVELGKLQVVVVFIIGNAKFENSH